MLDCPLYCSPLFTLKSLVSITHECYPELRIDEQVCKVFFLSHEISIVFELSDFEGHRSPESVDTDWLEFKMNVPNTELSHGTHRHMNISAKLFEHMTPLLLQVAETKLEIWAVLPGRIFASGDQLAELVRTGRWLDPIYHPVHNNGFDELNP